MKEILLQLFTCLEEPILKEIPCYSEYEQEPLFSIGKDAEGACIKLNSNGDKSIEICFMNNSGGLNRVYINEQDDSYQECFRINRIIRKLDQDEEYVNKRGNKVWREEASIDIENLINKYINIV